MTSRRPRVLVVDPKAAQPPLSVAAGWFGPDIDVVVPETFGDDEVARHLPTASAIITVHAPVTAAMMDGAPRLRVVSKPGVGTDNIDIAAAAARGVVVTNVPGATARAVAEHALYFLLALARHAWAAEDAPREPLELAGRRIGVLGHGRVGSVFADLAAGIGMDVVVWTRSRHPERFRRLELGALLPESDAVVVCLPLTPETHGIIDGPRLRAMQTHALLVNVGRGPLVVTDDLVAALEEGRLGGVGLDVTDPEPLPRDHPLRTVDRVVLTPHVGGLSDRATSEAARRLRGNVAGVLLDGVAIDPVTRVP